MYFSDHATEYQEVLSPAITVCSVSSENPYFSVFHNIRFNQRKEAESAWI